jgi:signal peptidase II
MILVIVLDQLTKALAIVVVPEWVRLNSGVAFSIAAPLWVVGLAALVLAVVAVWEWRTWRPETRALRAWAVGLVLGGAISNLVDRAFFGGVRDFIDLRFIPVFNLADTALTIGVIGLLWYALRSSHQTSHTSHGSQRERPRSRSTS